MSPRGPLLGYRALDTAIEAWARGLQAEEAAARLRAAEILW